MKLLEEQKAYQQKRENDHLDYVEKMNAQHQKAITEKIEQIEAMEKKFTNDKLTMEKEFRETLAFV